MLLTLNIENVAVIESAEISFTNGFNVLTGETGAGKSIIIGSINAILGERTYKDIIRNGCDNAVITAEFDVSGETANIIQELGYCCDDGVLLIQRKLSSDGKSSVRINGKPATVGILREIGVNLINIHGQHDSQSLLNPDSHLGFIDSMAENTAIFDEYYKSYRELVGIKHEIKELRNNNEDNSRLLEMLEFQVNELESANITVGERDSLTNRRNVIKNSEKIKQNLSLVKNLFLGDDNESGINDMLMLCSDKLSELESFNPKFKEFAEQIRSIEITSREVAADISSEFGEFDYDDSELENIEQRLNLLYNLSSKYGENEDKMIEFLAEAKEKLYSITNYDKKIEELENKFTELLEKTKKIAEKLTESRNLACKRFSEEVCNQLKFLDMPFVKFVAEMEKTKLTGRGAENVEFLISTNPGEPPKPLAKIASGGELSRIMLAIKSVLASADIVPTLIFDEIDSGISGSAAQKVGEKISSISKEKQIICVTHLAQIAALADTHFLISKQSDGVVSKTEINRLDKEGRINEIARIISGGEMTANLRGTAEEMLNKH